MNSCLSALSLAKRAGHRGTVNGTPQLNHTLCANVFFAALEFVEVRIRVATKNALLVISTLCGLTAQRRRLATRNKVYNITQVDMKSLHVR